jgi:hypothetical protein
LFVIQYPGGTAPNNLQILNLQTIGNDDCQRRMAEIGGIIFDSSLCAFARAGQGTCIVRIDDKLQYRVLLKRILI